MDKWNFIALSEICNLEKGKTGLMKAKPGKYPLVTTSKERKTCDTYQFDTKAVCIPLVSSTGHGHASLNYVHYQEGKFALGTILVAVIPKDETILNAQFLHLYLSRLKDIVLVPLMTGAANVTLTVTKLKTVKVPLPPIEEQLKIVSLFNRIDNKQIELTNEITYQQKLLKKLRQSVLQEAIEGKLTKEWREKNPDVERASVLLEKIKQEKEQLIKEKKIKKQKSLPPISEDEMPFEIPKSWEWSKLGDIAQHNAGKTLDISKNTGDKRECITTSNLYWGYFNLDKLKEIRIEENELSKCTALTGDILICEGGDSGRTAIWEYEYDICFQNHIHRVRLYGEISNYYIYYNMLLLSMNGKINLYKKGMGISNISGKSLSSIILPLPPLTEQKEIVKKIENLFALCDKLGKEILSSKKSSEELMQAVLKEAFEK